MLLTLGGGGGGGGNVQRGVQSTPHARGGLGACSPRKILKFRPSEITSGAFSSKLLPMICISYTLFSRSVITMQPCTKKQWQPSFKPPP